ncbi:MAG: hypothetical protein ACFFE4_09905 [Candidatus Thorarchaeota archaeon]
MEINELQKWNIAGDIISNFNAQSLIRQLANIKLPSGVNFKSSKIDKPIPYKVVLIDFEGSPAVLMGLLIQDTILTYFIEDYEYLTQLHLVILEVFSITRELQFFGFSIYEQQELLRIYTSLNEQGYDLSKYKFITSSPIINLQKHKSESVAEAVFSTNPNVNVIGDPLFRNIKVIDKLFMTMRIEEIITHNRTCLLNESIILHRWVRNYNLSTIKRAR